MRNQRALPFARDTGSPWLCDLKMRAHYLHVSLWFSVLAYMVALPQTAQRTRPLAEFRMRAFVKLLADQLPEASVRMSPDEVYRFNARGNFVLADGEQRRLWRARYHGIREGDFVGLSVSFFSRPEHDMPVQRIALFSH